MADDVNRVAGQIGEMVAELIGRGIGLDDNFFEAGLTSVTVTRLHTMLRTRLDTDLPVTALYSNPTARSAASAIDRRSVAGREPVAKPARPERGVRPRTRSDIRAELRRGLGST